MAFAKVANGRSPFSAKRLFQFNFFRSRAFRLNRAAKENSRTYIMPTGFGYAFGTMASVLLMMAMGYANNLMYFFVFMLISIGITSMYVTNQNVHRVCIEKIEPGPLFADETGALNVLLRNSGNTSFQLQVNFQKSGKTVWPVTMLKELGSRQSQNVSVSWQPPKRGYSLLPKLVLRSRFPFDLLQSWKTQSLPEPILVYPSRKGKRELPLTAVDKKNQGSEGLFRGHRAFQSTDSPRRVDWRATAKHQNLLIKNFESAEQNSLQFTWEQTKSSGDFEARISQLCLWITQAEESGSLYSLRIGSFQIAMGAGPAHLKQCLEKLALMKEGDV